MPHPQRPSRLPLLLTAAALAAMAVGCDRGPATTAYTPPATRSGADGADTYVGAPVVDRSAAAALDPALGAPEAAVVKFLASRTRGDDRWREAMVPGPPDARLDRALADWAQWRVQRFQLRGRELTGSDTARVRAWFEITVDGTTDEGEDEFELALVDGVWRIVRPPT